MCSSATGSMRILPRVLILARFCRTAMVRVLFIPNERGARPGTFDGMSLANGGPAILVEGLTKSFGQVHALRGIDLAVPGGTVLGLLGPTGAGKTTAVRMLTTL